MNENGSEMVMPVAPMGGYGYGNNGGGCGWGGDASFLLILFLFAMMGGGYGGFGGFGGMGAFGGGMFPWLLAANNNTDNNVQSGFNQAATSAALGDIQNAITTGFSNAEVSGCNRAMDAMQTAYNNQIAAMNQSFANQQALDARLGALEMAQQNCCCENRAAVADLKYTVATEACADRAAVNDALRDVIANNTANTQRVLDQMYQDKIDAKDDLIGQLRQEVLYARGQASQVAQNSAIINGVYNRLNECPVGTVPVYGEQPIFSCPNGNNGGCGCGSF